MSELFGRAARVVLGEVDISGLDVRFQVHRTLTPEPDTLDLTVWNLSGQHRAALQESAGKLTDVRLEAGYRAPALSTGISNALDAIGVSDAPLPLLFGGQVRQVHSYRANQDWLTEIKSGDGDLAKDKRVNKSFGHGTPLRFAIEQVAAELGLGVGQLPIATARAEFFDGGRIFASGVVMSGNGYDQLTRLLKSVGYEWTVQDSEIIVVKQGGSFGTAVLLSPSTGLVGSPMPSSDGRVSAQSLLQPDLLPGRQVEFDSKHVKGFYVVEAVDFTGETAGQDWYASIECKPL